MLINSCIILPQKNIDDYSRISDISFRRYIIQMNQPLEVVLYAEQCKELMCRSVSRPCWGPMRAKGTWGAQVSDTIAHDTKPHNSNPQTILL